MTNLGDMTLGLWTLRDANELWAHAMRDPQPQGAAPLSWTEALANIGSSQGWATPTMCERLAVRADARPIGAIALDTDPECRALSVAWWMAPPFRNSGLMHRGVEMLLTRLGGLDLTLCCHIDPGNLASLRLAEGLGFRHEADSDDVARYRLECSQLTPTEAV